MDGGSSGGVVKGGAIMNVWSETVEELSGGKAPEWSDGVE